MIHKQPYKCVRLHFLLLTLTTWLLSMPLHPLELQQLVAGNDIFNVIWKRPHKLPCTESKEVQRERAREREREKERKRERERAEKRREEKRREEEKKSSENEVHFPFTDAFSPFSGISTSSTSASHPHARE